MQLIIRTYNLELRHTFRISRQSFDHKKVMVVELKDGTISGYGEASENPYYNHNLGDMIRDLLAVKSNIEGNALNSETPETFWNRMYPLLKHNLFALCALDIAYHDLYSRQKNKKLYELWGYHIENNILSNFTIGIDSVENMLSKMKDTPWPIYKIKLGTKEDLKIIKALRKHTNAVFRIDANCAWSVEETLSNALTLKDLGVEFLEQPLPAEEVDGMKYLYKKSALPLIADESCQKESDVDTCFGLFHGVNIKLVKCGGLTPARRMLHRAQELGMKKMVGCMTESSVGISAIAHLVPELDYVDMDGAILLKQDIAEGVSLKKGKIVYSGLNGTGVKLLDLKPITKHS
ncbi:dipeptide epimerase [Lutimonas zeaxanthinifaciens]|uniref:dipeptide epimerase n=1 Tax=Lutimonas zeaxanthinifaciens TaxID=3060215 RepID=UPI00265CB801|nr:dipeptide epimerase [Lutimonas sp. YSD2104]WKK66168.1 dipeptide epimerase [Lutimonas sp. YSD2104]